MRGPVGSQLFVDVVIKPGHEGEDCDGNGCRESQHPNWSPDRKQKHKTSGKTQRTLNEIHLYECTFHRHLLHLTSQSDGTREAKQLST